MKIHGRPYRTIWVAADGWSVEVIDQTKLPFAFATLRLASVEEAARGDQVHGRARRAFDRGDGGLWLCMALRVDASDEALERAYDMLLKTRPTAINLKWALDEMMACCAQPAARTRGRGGLCAGGEVVRRRCGDERGDRAARLEADRRRWPSGRRARPSTC